MKKKIGGILLCVVSFALVLAARAVELSTEAQLVFSGASLEDLATHTLTARLKGDDVSDDGVEATFFYRQEEKDGDMLTKVTYQLQAIDYSNVRAVKVEFTNGDGGVYAKLADGNFTSRTTDFTRFGEEPMERNVGANNYIPYDLQMCEPAVAFSVNFTKSGKNLDSTSSVRYGAGQYAVPYAEWKNMVIGSANVAESFGGMTVAVSVLDTGNPTWNCTNLSSAKDLRFAYCNENSANSTPTVTVSGIQFANYRVVVYLSTSDKDKKFGYVTINGTDYTGGDGTTAKGTADWGSAGANNKAKGLREGVNYLVSDVISNLDAVTVMGHRGSSSRGCIAAVQIVNVPGATYTATIDDGGDKTFSTLAWNAALPESLASELVVVNVTENTTLALDGQVNAARVTFNVAEGKSLNLSGSAIHATSIVANGPGMIVFGDASQLVGSVSGNADIVVPGEPSGATFQMFTGTRWTLDTESGVASAVAPDAYVRSLAGWTAPGEVQGVTSWSVGLAETREEFGKGSMTVTDIPEGVGLFVIRPDGSSTTVTPSGGTATLSEEVKIDGAATLLDITFKNNATDVGQSRDCHFTYKAVDSFTLQYDSNASFNNDVWDDTTGVYIKHHPYVENAGSAFISLGDFAAVVVGTVSPTPSRQFIHLGSSREGGQGILIATTENANEVIIAANSGNAVDLMRGVKASVPNAATARHAFVIVRSGNIFNVWVDGVKRGSFTMSDGFVLGAASESHSGIQVGSDFGGLIQKAETYMAVETSDYETGVANVIRVFDYAITDEQAEAVFRAYPYVSQGGLYERTLLADGALSQTDAWTKEGDEETYDIPEGAAVDGAYYTPSAILNVNADSSLDVNADLMLETLTIGGSATVSFTSSGGGRMQAGSVIINSPVRAKYGVLDISAAAVQLGESGSLAFDCSGLDVSKIWTTTRYQLTGLIDCNDAKMALLATPTTDPERSWIEYNSSGSCYDLVVEPTGHGIWVGSFDGNLCDGRNWGDGLVPLAGEEVIIGSLQTATLTVPEGQSFNVGLITFPAGSAAVTIEGPGTISGIFAVNNQSTFVQTIDCPLTFSGVYNVYCDTHSVNFSGGATATCPATDIPDNTASHALMGEIHFTQDWTNTVALSKCYTVPDGSRLYGKHLTGTVGNSLLMLRVETGGWAEFDSILTGYEYGVVSVQGEIHVNGQWVVKSGTSGKYNLVGSDDDTGKIYAKGIWKDQTASTVWMKPKEFFIGSDGLGSTGPDWYMRFDVSGQVIHATEDFEIFSYGNKSDGDWGLYLDSKTSLAFDTAGHTITWNGAVKGEGGFTKRGEGTMVMNPFSSFVQGAVTVEEGTLLLMKSGATGSGELTVKSAAELGVTGTRPIVPGGKLTLEDSAILSFDFTDSNLLPVIDVMDMDVDVKGTVEVKVSGCRLRDGENVLTAGGKFTGANVSLVEGAPEWVVGLRVNDEGNIALDVKRHPFIFIMR